MNAKPGTLTAERVRELLDYDPMSGIFRWRVSRKNRAQAGAVAGTPSRGYIYIKIDGVTYRAHRIAWLYVHGVFPPGGLDHEDNIQSHNWINNLRPATQTQNNANSRLRSDSTSGRKGASWHKQQQRWRSTIRINGKQIHLGMFDTPAEAHAAYALRAHEVFGTFAREA